MKKIILAAVIAAVVLIAAILYAWHWLNLPVTSLAEPVNFTVARGESLTDVAENLAEQKLIKSAWTVRLLAKFDQSENKLLPGIFTISAAQKPLEILQTLQTSPKELTITILPGWRREEIAAYLSALDLSNFSETEFLQLTKRMEGQLMAETYRIFPDASTQDLVDLLHQQYLTDLEENEEIQTLLRQSGANWSEILVLASLLQREARDFLQMQNIATIINRRLADNYPLQLCASAQYARGQDAKTGKWWEEPTLADTQIDSPYNTYEYKGLPPAPICAVSISAVKAALTPAENNYYFYLHDKNGHIHYATTLEEHEANKAQYL